MRKRLLLLILCAGMLSGCGKLDELKSKVKGDKDAEVQETIESLSEDVIIEEPPETIEEEEASGFSKINYYYDQSTDTIFCTQNSEFIFISNKYHLNLKGSCADDYIILDGQKIKFNVDMMSATVKIKDMDFAFMVMSNEDFTNLMEDFSVRVQAEANNFTQPTIEDSVDEEDHRYVSEDGLIFPEGMEVFEGLRLTEDGDIVAFYGTEDGEGIRVEINLVSRDQMIFSPSASFTLTENKAKGFIDDWVISMSMGDNDSIKVSIQNLSNSDFTPYENNFYKE